MERNTKPKSKEGDGKDGSINEKSSSTKAKRREVLKHGLSSLTTAGLVAYSTNLAAARTGDLLLGDVIFGEGTIYYNVPKEESLEIACGSRNYSINRERKVMGLINYRKPGIFSRNKAIISDGSQFHSTPSNIYGKDISNMCVSNIYYQKTQKSLHVAGDYRQAKIDTELASNNSIKLDITDRHTSFERDIKNSRQISVSPGEEISISLPQRQVTVAENNIYLGESDKPDAKYKEIYVEPNIRVRNNGLVQVFGKEGHHVIPDDPSDPFVERFKAAAAENKHEKTVDATGDQLYIVRKCDKR